MKKYNPQMEDDLITDGSDWWNSTVFCRMLKKLYVTHKIPNSKSHIQGTKQNFGQIERKKQVKPTLSK